MFSKKNNWLFWIAWSLKKEHMVTHFLSLRFGGSEQPCYMLQQSLKQGVWQKCIPVGFSNQTHGLVCIVGMQTKARAMVLFKLAAGVVDSLGAQIKPVAALNSELS